MAEQRPRILSGGKSAFEKKHIGLGEFFFRQSNKYGEKICQIDAATGIRETYGSVNTKSIRLALSLKQFNLRNDDIVVSCLSNRMESIIPHMGTLYLGAIICALDPTQSEREYVYCLNLLQPKVIFLETICLQKMENAIKTLQIRPVIIVVGESNDYKTLEDFQKEVPEEKEFQPVICQNCHDTAIIFLSSGTTGLAKAVCLSHYSVVNGTKVFTIMDHLDPSVILSNASFYWISGILFLGIMFHKGGCKVVPGPFEPRKLLKTIEECKVTYLTITSMMVHSMLEITDQVSYDFSSLYSVTCIGGGMPIEKLKEFRHFVGTNKVTLGYGCSEAGMSSAVYDYTRDKEGLNKFGSSGRCVKDTEIKIVDINTRALLGPNEKGEFLIKSPYLFNGYYKTDSAAAFDQEGFCKTGDVAYYDEEEYVFIVGRISETFKYKTHFLMPSFLEAILLEHPAVKEAAIFGIPNDEYRNLPAALVTLKQNSLATEDEIESFYTEQVADYHKLRGGIKIIKEFDKTPSGKMQRHLLKEKFLSMKNVP